MKGAVKRGLDLTARCAVLSGFVGLLEKLGSWTRLLRVLTYHRVDEPSEHPDLYPNLIGATPREFDWQMRCLADHYRAVSLAEVLAAVIDGAPLPTNAVLITFDDAYQDFADHAWPVLKRYRLPVTLFVPTGYPDQPEQTFWWDRLYSALRTTKRAGIESPAGYVPLATPAQRAAGMRRLVNQIKSLPDDEAQPLVSSICAQLGKTLAHNRVLGWDALRQLAAEGVTLAPHTRQHPLLNRVSSQRVRDEITGSIVDLQREIGDVPPVLAYPSGAYDQRVVEMLPSLGMKLAFTTCRGINVLDQVDPFQIRRINVGRRTSPALMRAQLLPCAAHFNRWSPLPP
jgi:peptidoglycan/xylan/chitin deacetylase (PgdA/CDA1 family)